MATEIERKFLVNGDLWRTEVSGATQVIAQGYLNRDKERTVRIRINGDRAFLTVKGLTEGASRGEWEYEIPPADAVEMIHLSEGPVVMKARRVVMHDGMAWEIDEFLGENSGLIVAEIELTSEGQQFNLPSWVGEEVTHDPRYFNSSLSSTPFSKWTKA
jgi:adenylate cyclase